MGRNKKTKSKLKLVEPLKKDLTISFVLPVFNEQSNIADCVRSLLSQNIPGQIIVIDDCSTDQTMDIVETFRDRIENKGGIIIKNENRIGAAACRNLGNKLVTGDIILVCDAENYPKERSEAAFEIFTKHEEYSVMYSAYHLRPANDLYNEYEVPVDEWDFKSKCTISHPSVCYKKEVALAHPYHEETLESDLFEFMLLDMHKAGIKFAPCNNVLMKKIEGNSNRDMKKSKEIKLAKYHEYGIMLEKLN